MPLPSVTFPTFDDLENYIQTYIIPNGMMLITGDEHNSVENGLLTFIRHSPLNWQTAMIESSGGVLSAVRPVTVFMSTVPTSFTWPDNIYNQYTFINSTAGDIPTIFPYVDINLQDVNIIPAKSIVNIVKARNGRWIVSSVPSSGNKAAIPPYIGVVDRGNPTDPISGTSIFQDDSLIGLGATNGGNIQINYGEVIRSSFGSGQTFTFDNVTGEIDLDFNGSGEQFFTGSSLWIDRNQ